MPEPPWVLRGEAVIAWARATPALRAALPAGLAPVTGPACVTAAAYDDSPVGRYSELSVSVPARLGLRPGLCAVAMVVTSTEARLGCWRAWGLPAEVGTLRWSSDGDERKMTWEERSFVLGAVVRGPTVAVVAPVRGLVWRPDGPSVLPRRVWARARMAHCDIDVAGDDELAGLAGPHPGLALQGARIVAGPARRPAGLLSSVPWGTVSRPLGQEPAAGPATITGPRAYGSVG